MICKHLIISGIIINIKGFVICETPKNCFKFNTIENFLPEGYDYVSKDT